MVNNECKTFIIIKLNKMKTKTKRNETKKKSEQRITKKKRKKNAKVKRCMKIFARLCVYFRNEYHLESTKMCCCTYLYAAERFFFHILFLCCSHFFSQSSRLEILNFTLVAIFFVFTSSLFNTHIFAHYGICSLVS